jgi:hypothetical protein
MACSHPFVDHRCKIIIMMMMIIKIMEHSCGRGMIWVRNLWAGERKGNVYNETH